MREAICITYRSRIGRVSLRNEFFSTLDCERDCELSTLVSLLIVSLFDRRREKSSDIIHDYSAMSEATGVLRFTEQRPLPLDTYAYQVDDGEHFIVICEIFRIDSVFICENIRSTAGTLFLHKYSSPQRLYVEWM